MQALTNRTFDEIDVGASTSVTHALYKAEIEMLALVAGDMDAFHIPHGEVGDPAETR